MIFSRLQDFYVLIRKAAFLSFISHLHVLYIVCWAVVLLDLSI